MEGIIRGLVVRAEGWLLRVGVCSWGVWWLVVCTIGVKKEREIL